VRFALFVLLSAFILLLPAYRHCFGGRSPWVRPWMMYRDAARGLCALELTVDCPGTPPARLRVADAYALLGEHPRPPRVMESNARRFAERVAGRLAPGCQLRVTARAARPDGWELLVQDHLVRPKAP